MPADSHLFYPCPPLASSLCQWLGSIVSAQSGFGSLGMEGSRCPSGDGAVVGAPASFWLLSPWLVGGRGGSRGCAPLCQGTAHLELLVPGKECSCSSRAAAFLLAQPGMETHSPVAVRNHNPPSMIPATGQSLRRTWEALQGTHTDTP